MKIGVIGASGKVGEIIVEEALNRGHELIALVRDASKVKRNIQKIEKDIFNINRNDLIQFDVVVNAFGAKECDPVIYQTSTQHLINILNNSTTRLIVVGGAGSLYTDKSLITQVYQTPDFPAVVYPTSSNMAKALELLKTSNINWTFFAPAITFDYKGRKTGQYTLGLNFVILNKMNESYISYSDYVIALLDEIENQTFIRKVFTAVSEK